MRKSKNNKITNARKQLLKKAFTGIDRNKLAIQLLKKKNASRNIIDQIVAGHSHVSAERAVLIEKLTEGKVRRSILRPDIFECAV